MNLTEFKFDRFFKKWILIASILHFAGFSICYFFGESQIWILFITLLFTWYLVMTAQNIRPLPFIFGYANWVSIFRLICILIGFTLYQTLDDLSLLIIFGFAVLLDGLDGFLARKYNHQTKEGAILDMEIDALLVFILTSIHIENDRVHSWIIIPASLRFMFAWILLLFRRNQPPETLPKIVRATIAVIFFIALLIPFIYNSKTSNLIIDIAGGLIVISFGMSLVGRIKKTFGR